MSDDFAGVLAACISAAVIFGGVALLWVVSSHYEAESFARVCGTEVSTRDAMFLELRVDSCIEQ